MLWPWRTKLGGGLPRATLLAFALAIAASERVYYSWTPENSSFIPLSKPLPTDSIHVLTAEQKKEPFKFKGQAQQDRICLETFSDMKGGYYVDLAAHHWKLGSNSYNLEAYNDWRGICIEANPHDLMGLLAYRKCALYINPVGAVTGEKLKFNFHFHLKKRGGAFGGLVGPDFDHTVNDTAHDVEVNTVSLASILDHAQAPTAIQYLSLDIEGAEYFALKNFPFDKRRFLMITIERPARQLHLLLVKNGYIFVSELTRGDFGECLYLHGSIENLGGHVKKWTDGAVWPPKWWGQERLYLTQPSWNGSTEAYLEEARRLQVSAKPRPSTRT